VWMFGSVNGKRVRQSLDTLNWNTAEEKLRTLDPDEAPVKMTLKFAGDRFTSDCESRGLASESVNKYKLLLRDMCASLGESLPLKGITADDLAAHRETWKLAPISARKRLERLRTFFRFCQERGWVKSNPAVFLKAPQSKSKEVVPFSDSELEKIFWAAERYTELFPMSREYGKKVKAFVLVLRYTGLRIRDVACLRVGALKDRKIFMPTQKTGSQVWIPVPESVVSALKEIHGFGDYYFWSGNGLPKSAVADWQRTLAKVFKAAHVKGNPHKFRHTFATTLLQKGVSIEIVARLLGHADIRITQRHYSHWIPARQLELESAVEKAWKL
jgi:integrase/recombinase XerD